jgi:hypothetical protein
MLQHVNRKTASIFLIFSLLISTLLIIPSVKAVLIWSDETRLTTSLQTDVNPSIAQMNYNSIWSDETRLTTSLQFDGYPSIAQMNDNSIWIAWKSRRDGNSNIYYKVFNKTWSNDVKLTKDVNEDAHPSITQLKNQSIWVTWASNRIGGLYDLYYKSSPDKGSSWSNETRLTTSGNNHEPSVLQTSDEKIWVVWVKSTGTLDIYYKVFDGSTWSTDTPLITDPSSDNNPAIIQTQDGKIWLVWSSDKTGDFEIYYKTFNGTSWSPDQRVTIDNKNEDIEPCIFQTLDGVIWLVWASRPTSGGQPTDDLYYKTSSDNGNTWSTTTQFTIEVSPEDPDDDTCPAAIQVHDRTIWIIWEQNKGIDGGNYDLYYRTTLLGDVNNDGTINITDLDLIARAVLTTPSSGGTPGDWWAWNPACDLSNDGIVDGLDLAIAAINYGRTATPP